MERLELHDEAPYSPVELAIHAVRYAPVRALVQGRRVLDIACGQGLGAHLMRQWGAREVVGVDNSAEAIGAAQRLFGGDGLRFERADAVRFLGRARAPFDLVTCVETIEHVTDPQALLDGLGEAVKRRGLVYVTCPNDHWYFGEGASLNPYHLATYDEEAFFTLAGATLGDPEHRYLGSVAAGFSVLPFERSGGGTDYRTALAMLARDPGPAALPVTAGREPLEPATSLFFGGLWNMTGRPTARADATATWPASASYRVPALSMVPHLLADRGAVLRLVHREADGPAARRAARLAAAFAGRLTVEVAVVETADRLGSLAAALFKGRPAAIHLFGTSLAQMAVFGRLRELALKLRSRDRPRDVSHRIARPLLTFSAEIEPEADDFWLNEAVFFDAIATAQPVSRPVDGPARLIALPEHGADDADLVRDWLRFFARAETAHGHGLREARFGAVRRLMLDDRPPLARKAAAPIPAAGTTAPAPVA